MASSVEQVHGLQSHVEELAAAGVEAHYLTASALGKVEPSLAVGKDCGAAFVPGDSQIDAALAVALLRQVSPTCIKYSFKLRMECSSSFFSFLYLWVVSVCATLTVEKVSAGRI